MKTLVVLAGILAGLGLSGLLSALAPQGRAPAGSREAVQVAALADHSGTLQCVVIHASRSGLPLMRRAWCDMVPQLSDQTTIRLVCDDAATAEAFMRMVGDVRCRIEPLVVDHAITPWSRDRWIARREGDAMALLLPAHEDGSLRWPARAGDARASARLAAELGMPARQPGWDFDGGDIVCDARTAFVAPGVIDKNLGRIAGSREDLIRVMEGLLGRRVVLLADAPRHHAGMYIMAVGDDTVLVGDPSLGERLLDADRVRPLCPVGDDRSPAMQAAYDSVARQAAEAGYRVVRVPAVHGLDERTVITYTNVVLEQRADGKVCYLPVFRHAPELNRAATTIWQELGWRVVPVDCTELYEHGGTLRCIINVAARG